MWGETTEALTHLDRTHYVARRSSRRVTWPNFHNCLQYKTVWSSTWCSHYGVANRHIVLESPQSTLCQATLWQSTLWQRILQGRFEATSNRFEATSNRPCLCLCLCSTLQPRPHTHADRHRWTTTRKKTETTLTRRGADGKGFQGNGCRHVQTSRQWGIKAIQPECMPNSTFISFYTWQLHFKKPKNRL